MEKGKNKHLIQLGNQIREIRKERGLSQEQLAWDAGVGRAYMGVLKEVKEMLQS